MGQNSYLEVGHLSVSLRIRLSDPQRIKFLVATPAGRPKMYWNLDKFLGQKKCNG